MYPLSIYPLAGWLAGSDTSTPTHPHTHCLFMNRKCPNCMTCIYGIFGREISTPFFRHDLYNKYIHVKMSPVEKKPCKCVHYTCVWHIPG